MDYFFIGEDELATAFRFAGVPGVAVSTADEARAAFRRATRGWVEAAGAEIPGAAAAIGAEGCRVLVLTEEVADGLGDDLVEWQMSGRYPLVVELPGLSGRIEGRKTLVDSIRDAIGIRV